MYKLQKDIVVDWLNPEGKPYLDGGKLEAGTELLVPPTVLRDDHPLGPGLSEILVKGKMCTASTRDLQEALPSWNPMNRLSE